MVGSSSFCVVVDTSLLAIIARGGDIVRVSDDLNQRNAEDVMKERTTRKSITFLHPFMLAGVDEKLEAGTYDVETCEELIEGLSFVAYRRISTTIVVGADGYGRAARQVIAIDPLDLEVAQKIDALEAGTAMNRI
jgi:hypothetical protein